MPPPTVDGAGTAGAGAGAVVGAVVGAGAGASSSIASWSSLLFSFFFFCRCSTN